ncbi:hypothetical protein J437_LFUL019069 [Ladona fulva]|uniref:Uncharacterized protein n=1 Tax=Ladona fulva TaxID=123851 RepID=A0A8K0KT08_LADFU|nr:hypothetical protein J437_LFUL019069 [Ladona fulva]
MKTSANGTMADDSGRSVGGCYAHEKCCKYEGSMVESSEGLQGQRMGEEG